MARFHVVHRLDDTVAATITPLPDGNSDIIITVTNAHGASPMLHWGIVGDTGWEFPPPELWPQDTTPYRGNGDQIEALRTPLAPVGPGVASASIAVPPHLGDHTLAFVLYDPEHGYQHNAGADYAIPLDDDVRVLRSEDGRDVLEVQHITFTPPGSTNFLLPRFPLTVAVQITSSLPESELARIAAAITLLGSDGVEQSVPLAEVQRIGEVIILRGTILPAMSGAYRYRIVLSIATQQFCLARGEVWIAEPRAHETWTQGPMITQIDDELFLGNAAAAANPVMPETGRGLLEAHGVKAVLNATEDRDPSPALFGSGIEYVQFPFRDFSHNPMDEGKLWEAVQWIDERISHGKPVFIHCHAGIGRSGSLVVAYLLLCKYPEKSFDEVVALVNERLRHQRHAIYPHVGIPESVALLRMAIAERTANAQQFVHEQPVGEVLAVSFDTLAVEEGGVHTIHQLGVGHNVELRRGSRCRLRITVHYTGARPRGVYLYTNLNRDGPAFERRLMEPVAGHAATYQAELIPERCGDDFWITAFATPRQYDHDVKARWIGGNLRVRVTEQA